MMSNAPTNERELILKVADGDSRAFQELIRFYKDAIYTAALRLLQHRERAEDCTQDIFMKVWMQRATLPGIRNFGGWLHTITHHQLISALRQLAREKVAGPPDALELPARERTIEDILTQKQYAGLLQAALQALSDRQRIVYQLTKEQGHSREEAAAMLGISIDTVKFHLTEAMRRIRAYLVKNGDVALVILLVLKKF